MQGKPILNIYARSGSMTPSTMPTSEAYMGLQGSMNVWKSHRTLTKAVKGWTMANDRKHFPSTFADRLHLGQANLCCLMWFRADRAGQICLDSNSILPIQACLDCCLQLCNRVSRATAFLTSHSLGFQVPPIHAKM